MTVAAPHPNYLKVQTGLIEHLDHLFTRYLFLLSEGRYTEADWVEVLARRLYQVIDQDIYETSASHDDSAMNEFLGRAS